jgi:hypothetical protein
MRHTIIVTSMLLGMSGAIALASPDGHPQGYTAIAVVQH